MEDTLQNKDMLKFMQHIGVGLGDETLIVLKGHLLLEDLMREFCSSKMENPKPLEEARLGFSQIAALTHSLLKHPMQQWVWAGVKKVNNLRNMLAHNLEPNNYERKRNELITFICEQDDNNELLEKFTNTSQRLATSILVIHTVMSIRLRFKPKGLLGLAMELGENESSNK